jgi:hypothetical protein
LKGEGCEDNYRIEWVSHEHFIFARIGCLTIYLHLEIKIGQVALRAIPVQDQFTGTHPIYQEIRAAGIPIRKSVIHQAKCGKHEDG